MSVARRDIVAVFTSWNYSALMARVDPLVTRNVSDDDKRQRRLTFTASAKALGPLARIQTLEDAGVEQIDTPLGPAKMRTFSGRLAFKNGTGKLRLQLVERDNAWRILGYNIASTALPNGLSTAKPIPRR
jgi:hypothetical protein